MKNDDAYANAPYIPGGTDYPARWAAAAARWRTAMEARQAARLGLSYGPGPRHAFDLFLPEAAPRGLVVFVHGGFWRAFDRSVWSHLAAGPVARGWAVAMPSYTLAPAARISAITGEIRNAVVAAAGAVAGPVVLCGHSAGGHLVARLLCRDVALPEPLAARLARVVPISPLADLRPLLDTSMNADLRLDADEAVRESPAMEVDPRPVDTIVWVGAAERPAFRDQARLLAEAWPQARLHVAPDRHHFDVIADLEMPDSPLTATLLDGL